MALLPKLTLSVRAKLALALALAAMVPLLIVVAVGARITIGRLERGLLLQTEETARIAVNLLLRRVQRIAEETVQLADNPELHELVALEPELVPRFLEGWARRRGGAITEVALADGRVVGRVQQRPDAQGLVVRSGNTALERALDFERYLTLDRVGDRIVVRASAPIVDSMFVLRGAVVTTVPLDEEMAEHIRGVVRADIGFIVGMKPTASTFLDREGRRIAGVAPPGGLVREIQWGKTAITVQDVKGHEYAVGYAPLQTVNGRRIGMMAVGVTRQGLLRAKVSASRSLLLGGLGGLLFAVGIAYFVGRRITEPIARLHQSARAIAQGNLDVEVQHEADDELGDLARAFHKMTVALREHEARLAARVREISTLHQIGRAVSSVLSLDDVLRLVVREVTEVLGAEQTMLLLSTESGALEPAAPAGVAGQVAAAVPEQWRGMAEAAVRAHGAEVDGRLLAVPLETRERPVGALVVARRRGAETFSEGDLRLVVTFCDQAATAIENARLYDEVRTFSEELERKVEKRTAELRSANQELERTLRELREAQGQLIHSEKMAGLGTLVAGIAHEINTPAGAINGSIQALDETLQRLNERIQQLLDAGLQTVETGRFFRQVGETQLRATAALPLSPTEIRRRARQLGAELEQRGLAAPQRVARRLVESRAEELADIVAELSARVQTDVLVGIIEDLAFLNRSSRSIQESIRAIVRLVGTLKSYAHSDQAEIVEADLAEGIETTLTILHNELRYGIRVDRNYAPLPLVPVYVDQLNQVWTNLIQNSVQAMNGGGRIGIETFRSDDLVGVRITDDGPGIPGEIISQVFDPFFTTKARGEGTGLGLSIAHTIIEKHGGTITVASRPGRTTMEVRLPLGGPPDADRVRRNEPVDG